MSDGRAPDEVSAEGFAREEGISTQAIKRAIEQEVIPARRTDRGQYAFRREDVPQDWLARVKEHRDRRWRHRQQPRPDSGGGKGNGHVTGHGSESSCEFLKGQVLAQQATIDRLLTLLESRTK